MQVLCFHFTCLECMAGLPDGYDEEEEEKGGGEGDG